MYTFKFMYYVNNKPCKKITTITNSSRTFSSSMQAKEKIHIKSKKSNNFEMDSTYSINSLFIMISIKSQYKNFIFD